MSRSAYGPKGLGPLALVLCLLGLAAPAAHAEKGASWKVEGKDAASLAPAIAIKEIESNDATLTTKIAGTKVEVLCTGAQPVGIKLEGEGAITSGSQVRFSGCLTKLNGTTTGACEPNNGGKEPGAIASKALKGLLVNHEGKALIRLEPKEGETLATIETTSECSIGKEIPILGKLTLNDSSLETEAETHLVVEGALTALWAVDKTKEEHKATISGSMILQLAGTHAGKKWGGTIPKPVTGTWKLKGSAVTKELSPEVEIREIESRKATLLTTIGGTKVEVICEEALPLGIKLEPEGAVTVASQVDLFGCITKLNEKMSNACEPSNGGGEPGVIASKALKGLLIENEKTGLVVFEPKEGETLAVIETSEECAIGEIIPILGKLTLKDSSLAKEAETHLFVEGPLTELWAVSKTEEHKATIDGSVVVEPGEAHSGSPWCGSVPKGSTCGGTWMETGTDISGVAESASMKSELESNMGTLLTKVGGIPLAILCETTTLESVKLKASGTTTNGFMSFKGCQAYKVLNVEGPKLEKLSCTVKSASQSVGTVRTKEFHVVLELHAGKKLVALVVPNTSNEFATMEIEGNEAEEEKGKFCSVPSPVSIMGTLAIEDCENVFEKEMVVHLIIEEPALTHLYANSDTLEHKVTLDGSALPSLVSGAPWSGLAG